MATVDSEMRARGVAAAMSLARTAGLRADDAIVIQNSNQLALRLSPCEVFARTAVTGQEVAAFEVALAQQLTALGAPIARLDPRLDPRVYERDGYAVTFWAYCPSASDPVAPPAYADALQDLHAAMRGVDITAPHFTERISAAESLVADRSRTPTLDDDDRALLLHTLRKTRQTISDTVVTEQLLHGEPHPGNVLSTRQGLLFVDLETCCRGPVEFDVAHVPEEVCAHYPDIDQGLLQECRRLVLAMVAAWRWDARDEFPNGRQYGREIVRLLRAGPPWPVLATAEAHRRATTS